MSARLHFSSSSLIAGKLALVWFVANLFRPLGALAVELFRDGDVRHGRGSGGEPILAGNGGQTAECTHCGAHNATDRAFCGECGAVLAVAATK